MKLSQLPKGVRAVKAVPFRLANAPEPSAEEGAQDPHVHMVGVRVMTGEEIADAYQKAQADAAKRGIKDWLDTHPLCRLHLMAHTLAIACVDADARDEPFFVSADEVMSSPHVGGDNIAYLYEQQQAWQDECSIDAKKYTIEEVIGMLALEAARTENERSPFADMRPSSLKSFMRTTAVLWFSSLTANSLTGTISDSTTSETKTSELSETDS